MAMSVQPSATAGRDPERSRRAVLDAAERLFAERGFDGATMQEIGAAAGLSRGAPAYIFGSKRELYEVVLERAFEQRHEALAGALDAVARASQSAPPPTETGRDRVDDLERSLRPAVTAYVDFLAERPAFVRLMQWEALQGGGRLRATPRRSSAIEDLVAAVAGASGEPASRQLVLSFVALCFFPFEHAATMLPPLGGDIADRDFREERIRHVARTLAAAIADAERRR